MQTRRDVLGALGAVAIPGSAWGAAVAPDLQAAMTAMTSEGRYLPLRRLITTGDSVARQEVKQGAACFGDEGLALTGAADLRQAARSWAGCTAVDVLDEVVRQSDGRRIVMLNEAHCASRHRMLLVQTLRALRRRGFTHFAAETFIPGVEPLKAGDPVRFSHGIYIADPVFAEAVREALELGYQLVAYEQRPDQIKVRNWLSTEAVNEREQAQADNFSAALGRSPDARFVVYVGYGHLSKAAGSTQRGRTWFAARLAAQTGLSPLTLNQATTGSFGPHAPDSDKAGSVLQAFAPRAPIVVRDPDGRAIGDPKLAVDMDVYHPALPDVGARPGWLAGDTARRKHVVILPDGATSEPCLAQALHAADPNPAIPADQFMPLPGARAAEFWLREGEYRFRLETSEGFKSLGSGRVAA